MRYMRLVIVLALGIQAAFACEFNYDPASSPQYYRAEGWTLPGAKDFSPSTVETSPAKSIPGVVAQVLKHEESPHVVVFPAEGFLLKGVRQRMRPAQVEIKIGRWLMHGHTLAYSYSLIPVAAHRENGKWIIDSMAACIYFATFIDDKGDGVFRVLVPNRFTADLVPQWAKPKED